MSEPDTPISYTVRVTARHRDGSTSILKYSDYALLRELLDHIEEQAESNGWFVDPEKEGQ